MNVLNMFSVRIPDDENEDKKAIRLLGMRLFNGCAASFQLTMSGYYQAAGMLMRDLLETVFLLGFFDFNREMIAEWRVADTSTRIKKFGPATIRIALDEKDGFTAKKRKEEYDLLCEFAVHPTYIGLRMLAPRGHPHHCGPFLDPGSLKALIEHLAKLALQAAHAHSKFFEAESKKEMITKVEYLEICGEWCERHWGQPFDRKLVDELKEPCLSG